jgi:hypothetical protein
MPLLHFPPPCACAWRRAMARVLYFKKIERCRRARPAASVGTTRPLHPLHFAGSTPRSPPTTGSAFFVAVAARPRCARGCALAARARTCGPRARAAFGHLPRAGGGAVRASSNAAGAAGRPPRRPAWRGERPLRARPRRVRLRGACPPPRALRHRLTRTLVPCLCSLFGSLRAAPPRPHCACPWAPRRRRAAAAPLPSRPPRAPPRAAAPHHHRSRATTLAPLRLATACCAGARGCRAPRPRSAARHASRRGRAAAACSPV